MSLSNCVSLIMGANGLSKVVWHFQYRVGCWQSNWASLGCSSREKSGLEDNDLDTRFAECRQCTSCVDVLGWYVDAQKKR